MAFRPIFLNKNQSILCGHPRNASRAYGFHARKSQRRVHLIMQLGALIGHTPHLTPLSGPDNRIACAACQENMSSALQDLRPDSEQPYSAIRSVAVK